MTIKILLLSLLVSTITLGQSQYVFSVELNGMATSTGNYPIYSFKSTNIGVILDYELKNSKLGLGVSITSQFRPEKYKVSKYRFKENFHLYETFFRYEYNLFKMDRHKINHSVGFIPFKQLYNKQVLANVDTKFLNSIDIFYNILNDKSATLLNIYGFIDTGYSFYLKKGFYFSLTGRATLLSYTLNYDYEGEPLNPNPKKLGLNYMLFYGLGYTFGKN